MRLPIFHFLLAGCALGQSVFAISPYSLSEGPFAFDEWNSESAAGTYPPHMIFEQVQLEDPGLTVEMDGYWELPYNLTSRSRINGLGIDGISFINTGSAQGLAGAGYLGSAILALNTLGQKNVRVQWNAGTVTPNERVCGLRLQYRVGSTAQFADVLDGAGNPLEYLRNETPGHVESFGPVALPAAAEGEPLVELRWKYYYVSGDSGPRAELRLDNISVFSGPIGAASSLAFDNPPPATAQTGNPLPPIIVRAVDQQGLTDATFDSPVTLTLQGDGNLIGMATVDAASGVASFEGLSVEGAGEFVLTAESSGFDSAATAPFVLVRVTELVMPQYMQGDQDADGNNNNRVPFAFRLRLEGLIPNATYRYGNRVVAATDAGDQDGAGNAILITGPSSDWIRNTDAPGFNPEDLGLRHLTFVTDNSGSYSGWFITEPSGNARFTPGNTIFARLLLNDGQGGTALHHFLTAPSGIGVRRFGAGPGDASSVYADATTGPRNFVLLFDNQDGSGRPLSATMVEATGVAADLRYADFYLAQVADRGGRWGTLLPNNLPSGVRRIEERALLDGATLAVHTSANGFAETTNPSGGASPIFANINGGPEFLPVNDGAWNVASNWSGAAVPNGIDERATVSMTAALDRTVSLSGTITSGALALNNETALRDRVAGGLDAAFAFQSTSGEASLLVGGQGSGFHELEVQGGIALENDLRVTVNNTTSAGEHGALRIRETLRGPGALIKDGFGVLSLTGGNKDYTGETRIEGGVLRVTESSHPGSTSGISVFRTGQLRLVSHGENRFYNFGGPLTLDSLGQIEGSVPLPQAGRLGALRLDPELHLRTSNDPRHTATVVNPIAFAGDSHVHVDGSANRLTLTGTISGPGTLIKSGGGDLVLTGDNALFDGAVILQNGSTYIETGSSLGSGPLFLHASSDLTPQLFLNNAIQTVSSLQADVGSGGSATVTLGESHLLHVDQASDSQFDGSLTGSGSLRKTGAGILSLNGGPNDFSGSLEIASGVLNVTEPSQPSAVSKLQLQDGGQLRLTSAGTRSYRFGPGPLILRGAGLDALETSAKGVLRQEGGDNTDVATVMNAVEIPSDTAWIHVNRDVGEGSVLALAGQVSGSGNLRKTGGGTLELRGANRDFTGGTTIENGLLRVMPGSSLGDGPLVFVDPERQRFVEFHHTAQTIGGLFGTTAPGGLLQLKLAAGHTLTVEQQENSTFTGSLDGLGNLVKTGLGGLVLGGDGSLTGSVLVESGTLRIDGSFTAIHQATIAAGARLEGTGAVSGLHGGGTVAPGADLPGILNATTFHGDEGLDTAFRFSRTGSPTHDNSTASGNDLLRLSGIVPFNQNLDSQNTISIFLDVAELAAGDVFRGGFFTERDEPFDETIREAGAHFYLRDLAGAHEHRGGIYRLYDGPLFPITDTVPESEGQIMRISWTSLADFNDWQAFHFSDPDERNDPEIGGLSADPNGHGMSNLIKYALGLDPSERAGARQLSTSLDEAGQLAIRFHRDPAKGDIAYIVEGSTDLLAWDVFFDSRNFSDSNNSGDLHEVLVPSEPEANARSRFVRLRVILLTE